MSLKISATRRAAFLKALAQSGNFTLAAERTNVSRSWVLAQRKRDCTFDEACRAAAVEARQSFDRLRTNGKGASKPPSGWGHLDGVQLVVRGSGGGKLRDAAGAAPQDERKYRRVQIARARVKQWSPQVEERFLAVLAATCNVKASYEAVGMSKGSAYTHRARWKGFAERWDEAVETGYARLELGLIEKACNLFSEPEVPEAEVVGEMSVGQALQVLNMHKHQVKGSGRRPGRVPGKASMEEVCSEITRLLKDRKAPVSAAEKARAEREWALRRGSG